MPPVVSIVGKSNTGKTTFLEKLIRELTSRGYKVGTIKHSHHSISFDQPSKDSWRHAQAGSTARVISSTTEIALLKPVPKELTIEEIAHIMGEDFDIVLTEGFSRGDAPKIEIHRKEAGPLLEKATKRIALVTDEHIDSKVRQYGLDDVKGVADLLETGFIKPQQERISFYVNDSPVSLSEFPRQIITNMLLAMAASLKGVDKVKTMEISLRRKPE